MWMNSVKCYKTDTEMTVAQFDWSRSEAGRGLMIVAKMINTNPQRHQSHHVVPIKT
jgi:hypothetical protein